MKCPDANHVHETGDCPLCLAVFDVAFVRPDEEVDCPECGFKVAVPAFVVERIARRLRTLNSMILVMQDPD